MPNIRNKAEVVSDLEGTIEALPVLADAPEPKIKPKAKKTYRFKARVAIHDPTQDRPGQFSTSGALLAHPVRGRKWIEPGEAVDLDHEQGEAILKVAGHYSPTPKDDGVQRLN